MRFWALLLTLVALLGLRLGLGVSPSAQLADLLPPGLGAQSQAEKDSFPVLQDRFDRQLWLLVEAKDPDALVSRGQALSASAKEAPFVAAVQGGPSDGYQALGRYRGQLLADADRQLPDQTLLNRALALWLGPVPSSLKADPLLTFSHWLEAQQPHASSLALHQGWPLWHKDGHYALVLTLTLKDSAYDSRQQGAVQQWLQSQGPDVAATGTVLYAAKGAQQAQAEVSRFGTLALVAVLVLIFWGFGGWGAIRFMGGLLLLSLLGALAGLWWCFPKAHWLALVMGASVIGICADYGFHALAVGKDQPGIRRPLLWGLVSSLLAYGVMSLSPFPGLAQLGVTAVAGLLTAYLYVRFLAKVPDSPSRHWPERFLVVLDKVRRPGAVVLALGLLVFITLGVTRLSFEDNVRQWQPKDPALLAVEGRLAYWLGARPSGQYLLVPAKDVQGVLAAEEALRPRLQALVASGNLQQWLAVSQAVPSQARQQADWQRLTALRQRLDALLGGALGPAPAFDSGLQPGALHDDGRLALLLDGPAPASVILLQGLTEQGAAQLGDLLLVSPADKASAVFSHYRDQILTLLAVALAALAMVLVLCLRGRGLAVLATSLAALGAGLAIPAYLGQPFNLIHALALVLVLGLSLDYGFFFATGPSQAPHTLLAVLLSMVSSLFAFGLLTASSTPVLVGFGAVVAAGLLSAFLASLFWARP